MMGIGLTKLCWDWIGDGFWRDDIQIIDVWKLRKRGDKVFKQGNGMNEINYIAQLKLCI